MTASLNYLLQDVSGLVTTSFADLELSSMTLDSRAVDTGGLFVALKGTNAHGLAYAASAVQLGAVAIIWDYDESIEVPELAIPLIAVKDLPTYLGDIAARFYGAPSQKMQLVGVTGTDGKTSVSHFLAQAMKAAGKPCSVIGTLGIGQPDSLEKATHTTPDVISVHQSLQHLHSQGSDCVVMEVSSHALDQQRVAGVNFDVAVLTNLTRDHLDYHGTVEAYAAAKAKLFLACQPTSAVINFNDAFGLQLADALKQRDVSLYGYAIGDTSDFSTATLVASNAQFNHQGLQADVTYQGERYRLAAAVLGDFNLSNLLAAAAALIALGHSAETALQMVAKVKTVPGRIEKIETAVASPHFEQTAQEFLAVVDYAHTPAALESVLSALRAHCAGQLICVFGCGGDRDKGKRPLMAAVAEQLADVVIVTDDNPRNENPQQIVADIMAGFKQPALITLAHDRAVAITKAISLANEGDVVLVAGKGHEQSQLIQGKAHPFDDREQIRQNLAKLFKGAAA